MFFRFYSSPFTFIFFRFFIFAFISPFLFRRLLFAFRAENERGNYKKRKPLFKVAEKNKTVARLYSESFPCLFMHKNQPFIVHLAYTENRFRFVARSITLYRRSGMNINIFLSKTRGKLKFFCESDTINEHNEINN